MTIFKIISRRQAVSVIGANAPLRVGLKDAQDAIETLKAAVRTHIKAVDISKKEWFITYRSKKGRGTKTVTDAIATFEAEIAQLRAANPQVLLGIEAAYNQNHPETVQLPLAYKIEAEIAGEIANIPLAEHERFNKAFPMESYERREAVSKWERFFGGKQNKKAVQVENHDRYEAKPKQVADRFKAHCSRAWRASKSSNGLVKFFKIIFCTIPHFFFPNTETYIHKRFTKLSAGSFKRSSNYWMAIPRLIGGVFSVAARVISDVGSIAFLLFPEVRKTFSDWMNKIHDSRGEWHTPVTTPIKIGFSFFAVLWIFKDIYNFVTWPFNQNAVIKHASETTTGWMGRYSFSRNMIKLVLLVPGLNLLALTDKSARKELGRLFNKGPLGWAKNRISDAASALWRGGVVLLSGFSFLIKGAKKPNSKWGGAS